MNPINGAKIFLVAVEESADRLGGALMRALRERMGSRVQFVGVGGQDMAAAGLDSLHSIEDFSIVGFSAIPRRLPRALKCMRKTLRAVQVERPDALVVIDSPIYTLPLARRVRRADPSILIIDYVPPPVWAWRFGRVRNMRRYIDHILALLPFEPTLYQQQGGPPCTFVGHPLIEEIARLRPSAEEIHRRATDPPVILVFPGSRSGEISRHAQVFGDAIRRVSNVVGAVDIVLPTLPHLLGQATTVVADWPVRPRILVDPVEKNAACRVARAALAKSGTVTLELALAGVPMVTAYKVSNLEAFVGRRMLRIPSYVKVTAVENLMLRRTRRLPSFILANLVLGENIVPELMQEDCTGERLAAEILPLIGGTPERRHQVEAFAKLDHIMGIGTERPALRAADIVISMLTHANRNR